MDEYASKEVDAVVESLVSRVEEQAWLEGQAQRKEDREREREQEQKELLQQQANLPAGAA